jgi:hypothetical protein
MHARDDPSLIKSKRGWRECIKYLEGGDLNLPNDPTNHRSTRGSLLSDTFDIQKIIIE